MTAKKIATASDWIATDPAACRRDVRRLGLTGAARYQVHLMEDRAASGDCRWEAISLREMQLALSQLEA